MTVKELIEKLDIKNHIIVDTVCIRNNEGRSISQFDIREYKSIRDCILNCNDIKKYSIFYDQIHDGEFVLHITLNSDPLIEEFYKNKFAREIFIDKYVEERHEK